MSKRGINQEPYKNGSKFERKTKQLRREANRHAKMLNEVDAFMNREMCRAGL